MFRVTCYELRVAGYRLHDEGNRYAILDTGYSMLDQRCILSILYTKTDRRDSIIRQSSFAIRHSFSGLRVFRLRISDLRFTKFYAQNEEN